MADDFRDLRNDIQQDVKEQISAARQIFQEQITEEQRGAQEWIAGGGCQAFYQDLKDLMERLRALDTELLAFAFDPDCEDAALDFFTPDVGLELPETANESTCKLLYPMYTVLVTGENLGMEIDKALDFVQCMSDGVTELVALARLDTSDPEGLACQTLMDERWNLRGLTQRMTKGSIALESFGGALEKRSKGKDVNVAIWGWVGFTIKVDTLHKIATRSKSASSGLTKLTDYVNEKLKSCESEEILNSCGSQPQLSTDLGRTSLAVPRRR